MNGASDLIDQWTQSHNTFVVMDHKVKYLVSLNLNPVKWRQIIHRQTICDPVSQTTCKDYQWSIWFCDIILIVHRNSFFSILSVAII